MKQQKNNFPKGQPIATLNNGRSMPLVGFGTYRLTGADGQKACEVALETGYRLIDTAASYGNETEVGNAIRNSGIRRDDLFVTTKVNNPDQGYDSTIRAFDTSLKKLDVEYLDLYLVHWPIKSKRKETWEALEKLYADKRVHSIGVANYLVPFLKELETYSSIIPTVNQLEFSPFLFLEEELNYCRQHQIILQAYSPLTRAKKFNDPRLLEIANQYHKTPAQVILKWNIQQGISVVPRSSNPGRIKENFDLFDFELSASDIKAMDGFNENFRIVDSPMSML